MIFLLFESNDSTDNANQVFLFQTVKLNPTKQSKKHLNNNHCIARKQTIENKLENKQLRPLTFQNMIKKTTEFSMINKTKTNLKFSKHSNNGTIEIK